MDIVGLCILLAVFFAAAFSDLIDGRFPYYILEELSANTRIGNVAIDAKLSEKYDSETYRALTFSFLNQGSDDRLYLFSINTDSSIISTATKIDRDSLCGDTPNCYVPLDVAVGPVPSFEIIKIIIEIIDINDHSPVFNKEEYVLNISESARIGTSLSLPLAEDLDSLQYSIKRYELVPENVIFKLHIETDEGGNINDLQLVTMATLDHELTDIYQLKLVAHDGGLPVQTGEILLNIRVLDSNDNSPEFENRRYEVFIAETIEIDTVVAKVTAHDNDAGRYGVVTYSFSFQTQTSYGDTFHIDNVTGEISVIEPIDFETQSIYVLEVVASDQGNHAKDTTASVTVRVVDVNDWTPHITINTLNSEGIGRVAESAEIGTFIASVTAIDQDGGRNGQVTCTSTDPSFAILKIHEGQFKLISNKTLDRESKATYNVEISCSDLGSPPLRSAVTLQVEVTDSNDMPPRFNQPFYEVHILENNEIGEEFLKVEASDSDAGLNGQVVYDIEPNYQKLFNIDLNEGVISADVVLDREALDGITFRVFAYDMGSPRQTGTATVHLILDDTDDCPPLFDEQSVATGIFENEAPGSLVGRVTAIDKDDPPNDRFHYEIATSQQTPFDVDAQSGEIVSTRYLDRESRPVYYFTVLAISNDRAMTSSASVTVYVADRNDKAPVFIWPTQGDNTIHIAPNTPVGTAVTRLRATDEDIGDNAKLEYSLHSSPYFQVHLSTGAVTVSKELTDIAPGIITLRVTATDWGQPSLSTSVVMHIVLNHTLSYSTVTDSSRPNTDVILDEEAKVIILNNNKIIIISLASVGLLLLFAIVLAIILVKRMVADRSHDSVSTCGSERPLPVFRSGESSLEFT